MVTGFRIYSFCLGFCRCYLHAILRRRYSLSIITIVFGGAVGGVVYLWWQIPATYQINMGPKQISSGNFYIFWKVWSSHKNIKYQIEFNLVQMSFTLSNWKCSSDFRILQGHNCNAKINSFRICFSVIFKEYMITKLM